MGLTSSTVRRLDQVLGKDAACEIHQRFSAVGGDVVHVDGDEEISGTKTFAASIGVNGVSYDWPRENADGVLTNDGTGKLSWSVLAGVGTVTSVGLRMPPEYIVSGSPVDFSGDFVVGKVEQAVNVVYAGPSVGKKAIPGFRKLVVDDLPELPIEKVHGLRGEIDDKATISTFREVSEQIQGILEILEAKADDEEIKDLLDEKVEETDLAKVESAFATALARKPSDSDFRSAIEKVQRTCSAIREDMEARFETAASLENPSFSGIVMTGDVSIGDGSVISVGMNKGTKVGKSKHEKIGFFGGIPVPQPSGDILTAVSNLGLIKDPSIWITDVVGLAAKLDSIEEKIRSIHG